MTQLCGPGLSSASSFRHLARAAQLPDLPVTSSGRCLGAEGPDAGPNREQRRKRTEKTRAFLTLSKWLFGNDAKTCPGFLCDHRNTYTKNMNLGV